MAELIDLTAELQKHYEPKRKNRWILEIDGVPSYMMKTAKRPGWTTDEHVIDYLNFKTYFAGKQTFDDLSMTLYDPIAPSGTQALQEWMKLTYEAMTGRAGYASMYKKGLTLKMLDPMGAVVEKWRIEGAWIKQFNPGDLDYTGADPLEIQITIRYDRAVQEF